MLKPIKRDQVVGAVSIRDSAIDHEQSPKILNDAGEEILEYVKTRFQDPASWRDKLAFHDGEVPTEFLIGIVPSATLNRIMDECVGDTDRPCERYWRCFLSGVRDIVGMECPKEEIHGVKYVKATWLRDNFVGPWRDIALEIGATIWVWNTLGPGDVGN
jgi:hypothetical protein